MQLHVNQLPVAVTICCQHCVAVTTVPECKGSEKSREWRSQRRQKGGVWREA